jgi:hypothetical protein
MNIEKALFQLFGASPALAALIGTRVYGLVAPDRTDIYPCVVRVLYGREFIKIYDTPGRSALVNSHYRFIVMSVGKGTYDNTSLAAEALRIALEGYRGNFTDTESFPTVHIDGVFLSDQYEGYDDKSELVQIALEFDIHHTQEIRNS